jgi:hypothetical protein
MTDTVNKILRWARHDQAVDAGHADLARVLKSEQYIMHDIQNDTQNNVTVIIPPKLHHVVTLKLRVAPEARALHTAQKRLEHAIERLERHYAPTPSGLGITIGWGLSYFRNYVTAPAAHYLPIDNRASVARDQPTLALLDAIKFPSDPDDLILEQNDAVVLLRSDHSENLEDAHHALIDGGEDFWEPTSIRKGFIGGDLPRQLAVAAGVPGADKIPPGAQLFLGFTSSQKAALGSDSMPNFDSIPGLTNQFPMGYFRSGCTMHLSHLYEDLEKWYAMNYKDRLARAFRPNVSVPEGTQTVPDGPSGTGSESEIVQELQRTGVVGHTVALHPATRLAQDLTDNYGNFYPKGTAIPLRADFNTLDNPFAWTAHPMQDRWADSPAAGLHFLVFVPTSDSFHRARMAMDGHYPDGRELGINPHSANQGMNAVLRTTHRQNFLVPPREHRAFPLAELL